MHHVTSRMSLSRLLSLALASGLGLAVFGLSSYFGEDASAGLRPSVTKPPRIVLESTSDQLRAKRGSYCSRDGCVDTEDPRTETSLRAPAGSTVRVKIKAQAETVELGQLNGRRYAAISPELSPGGINGRVWTFEVQPRKKPVNLLFFVRYRENDDGLIDGFFGGRIRSKS